MPKDTSGAVQAEARRLTAIMFTDMVGFSRQMGADEYTRVDQHTARHLPALSFGHRQRPSNLRERSLLTLAAAASSASAR